MGSKKGLETRISGVIADKKMKDQMMDQDD